MESSGFMSTQGSSSASSLLMDWSGVTPFSLIFVRVIMHCFNLSVSDSALHYVRVILMYVSLSVRV